MWKSSPKEGFDINFGSNLSGVETFSKGEEISHIKIDIDQFPRKQEQDQFTIRLIEPKNVFATLDEISECDVIIENDIGELNL